LPSKPSHLLCQVVDADGVLSSYKEEGFAGMEGHSHHPPPVLTEGILCGSLGQLVHQNRLHGSKEEQHPAAVKSHQQMINKTPLMHHDA
jgi:hypothetical protein